MCALGSGPDSIHAREQFPTTSPGETLERIVSFFERHPAPAALGVGSFGPVNLDPSSPTWGQVTTTPKPGWQRTPVATTLEEHLQVPVAFETDVNVAALGEYRWGAGRGCASVCFLTVGTGIGAGLVIEGKPVHGLIHPEVGHLRIPHDLSRDPFRGNCPAHGDCWEGLASGPAIAERWGKPSTELPDGHPAWPLEAEYLALGILSIVCVVSPQRVIVGGGVMGRPPLMQAVRQRLRELVGDYLDTPALSAEIDDYLVPPELGDDAGVLGAIALAQERR